MDLSIDTLWFEVAVVTGITAIGTVFFGHFEQHTPKTKKILKLIFFNVAVVLLSKYAGRPYAFGFLGLCLLAVVYIHGVWLPGKGINGLTGEPKDKYYKLRGWEKYLNQSHSNEKNQSVK